MGEWWRVTPASIGKECQSLIAVVRAAKINEAKPLLEACAQLICLKHKQLPGSTLALLRAIWGCMIVDASPFDDSNDCLGLPSLLLMSMVAKANPLWTLPPPLHTSLVTAVLRTARTTVCQPWIGFVWQHDGQWELEETGESSTVADGKARNLRNVIRAAQCAVEG